MGHPRRLALVGGAPRVGGPVSQAVEGSPVSIAGADRTMLHDSTSGERLAATPREVGAVADAWQSGVAPAALNLGRSRKIDHVGQGRLLAVAGRPRPWNKPSEV